MRRALLCLLAPLLLVGPALLPGQRLLPQLPVGFEPLAAEQPEAAARAWERANLVTSDRLFPLLTDELAIRAQLAAGHLPLWEPGFGMGTPLFAGTVVGPAYPPNWLRYLLPPDLAGGWLALLSLWLAGLGMWLLLERAGLVFGAAAVGAVGYQVAGFGAVNLHYVMKVDAALWLPWALWAIEGLYGGARRAGLWLTAAIACALLAGFPQIGVFTSAAALAYAAWRGLERRVAPRLFARALGCAALGLGAAAVQLAPMAEASAHAVRRPQSAAALWPQRLPPIAAWSVPLPRVFFGDAADGEQLHRVLEGVALPAPGYVNPLEWTLGGGLGLTLLALAALLARPRRALFPALLALTALGFAQGWPLVRLLYYLPGAGLGAPGRAGAVLWICVPWLAALAVQALLERARTPAVVALLGSACALLAGRGHLGALLPAGVADALSDAAPPALALGLVALAVASSARAARVGLGALLALLLAGGWLDGRAHLVPRALGSAALFPDSAAMEAVRAAAGDGRVLRFDPSDSGIDDVLVLARPNLPQAYGSADLTPYIVFTNARLVQLFEALDPRTRYRSGISRLADPAQLGHPLLDLARVTCVLSRRPLAHPRLEETFAREGFHVYRRSGALPIARGVARAVTVATDAAAVSLLAAGAVPLEDATVLAGDAAALAPPDGAPGRVRVLRVERPAPGRLDVEVEGDAPGLVVFTEAWMPGWRASVNGRDAPLVRADHVGRAVPVPAGSSLVRTRYEPGSLRLGALITALSLLAAVWWERRARVSAP